MDTRSRLLEEMTNKELFSLVAGYGHDYIKKSFDRNVYPTEEALAGLSSFREALPETFTSAENILNLLNDAGSPATVSQIGGRYFGFVNGGVVPAGLLARLLSDCWDQNTGLQVISPLASVLETVVQGWLVDLFGLPRSTVAGFVSGTSMATFCGLAAARYRILKRKGWDINDRGMSGAPRIRVVAGRQAHSTVLKAVGLLGFGKDNIEWVDTDDQGRMVPEKLPELDDISILILQAGNVNTGSFDDFGPLCDTAAHAGAWVHIDGAFGLWAAAVDRLSYLAEGIGKANSWSVDAHKTLNTPYDNGIVLCKDSDALTSALHMTGSYIVLGQERDGMFFTPEMSKRARIIELWAVLKSLGKRGINDMVQGMHERAEQFAQGLEAAGFEVLNEVVFNQVIARYRDDATTKRILKEVQNLRVCWCGGSRWQDKDVIRISVCSWVTSEEDVGKSLRSFIAARDSAAGNAG